jgi:hypothetical protein
MNLKHIHINNKAERVEEEELHLRSKIGTAEPFKVPDYYFDSLTSRIQDRISANEKRRLGFSDLLPGIYRKRIWIPSLAGILLLFVVIVMNTDRTATQNQLSKTDSVIIRRSDINNSYAIEAQYIEAAKTFEQIDVLPVNEVSMENLNLSDGIKNEDIIKYLNDQEIDPTLLADL